MKGRLLIVDDEPLIRRGLAKLVEKNPLGWSVIGEAGNGQEAYARLEELRPDLVITDIRMPLMDGLELARQIAVAAPETAVIILTGYRDFEYAQMAIQYGVKQFLLKPCPEEAVCRVLQEAFQQYRERETRKEREQEERLRREDQLLRSVLTRLPYDAEEAAALQASLAGRELWLIQVNQYYPEGRAYRREDLKLLQFAIGNILQELLDNRSGEHRWIPLEYDTFAFFLGQGCNGEAFAAETAGVVKQLLGIELEAVRFGGFREFKETEVWLENRLWGKEPGDAAGSRTEESGEMQMNEAKARLIRGELTSLLLLGRPAELASYMKGLLESVKAPSASIEIVKMDAFCIAMAMVDVMRKELEADPAAIGDIGGRVAELNRIRSAGEVVQWLSSQVQAFEKAFLSWQNEHNSGLISRALRYMEEHYAEECSLAAVAAHAHLSPNYFGNLFKKETGESFSAYVARLRMDKAKLFLKNTDMKVAEIAQSVGYPDSNYFATAFKQTVGLSPTEFRKQQHN
ncbi:MAG: response regulator [Paenibacillaceae bacterium]|nr:response regulator [Paenibacillaceae bacterium]